MDRNLRYVIMLVVRCVALRKESVDRNFRRLWLRISVLDVALRKESVDRNIMSNSIIHKVLDVALRKESVDRNQGIRGI